MSAIASLAQEMIARLAWTSLQAALLVGAVWLLNRYLPRLSAATRSLLWWLLGVQLLLGLLLPTPVGLPLLSPSHTSETTVVTTTTSDAERAPYRRLRPALVHTGVGQRRPDGDRAVLVFIGDSACMDVVAAIGARAVAGRRDRADGHCATALARSSQGGSRIAAAR